MILSYGRKCLRQRELTKPAELTYAFHTATFLTAQLQYLAISCGTSTKITPSVRRPVRKKQSEERLKTFH